MKIRVTKPAAMDGTGGKGERAAGAKGKLRKLFLHDGDKTQKSWKPLLNTIFVLEAYRNAPCNEFRSSPLPPPPFLSSRPSHPWPPALLLEFPPPPAQKTTAGGHCCLRLKSLK